MSELPRSEPEKVDYLMRHLSEKKPQILKNNPRITSFANLYMSSIGGSADINEHSSFFRLVHDYATSQLDKVFYEEFGEHLAFSHRLRFNYVEE